VNNERTRVPIESEPSRTQDPADKRAQRRSSAARGGHEGLVALVFLAPALVALVLFRLVPAGSAVVTSFKSPIVLAGVSSSFAGLDNYKALLTSPDFLNSVKTTVLFVGIVVPLQTAVALALALLLTRDILGAKTWRLFLFLPFSVPLGISPLIWGVAMRPDGPMNAVLTAIGFEPQRFFTSASQALPSIMIVVSWIGVGYWMVFLIAGLQDIPNTYLEAAAIDGAGPLRTFFHVVLPLMRRPLAFVLVANTVANFILFAPIQALTGGGPKGSTDLIMYDTFEKAFIIGDRSAASAEVVLLLIIMLAIVIVQFRLLSTEGTTR
jgi:multiple sugar transport system permease protein